MSNDKQVTRTNACADQPRAALPAVDVFEDELGITLLADMPGVRKDHQLELRVEGLRPAPYRPRGPSHPD